jgi:hypothetical protein
MPGTSVLTNSSRSCNGKHGIWLGPDHRWTPRREPAYVRAPAIAARRDRWEDHFAWDGIHLVGKTAIGRTTVRVLNMNSEDQLLLRSA